jgi:hypothetical protein
MNYYKYIRVLSEQLSYSENNVEVIVGKPLSSPHSWAMTMCLGKRLKTFIQKV